MKKTIIAMLAAMLLFSVSVSAAYYRGGYDSTNFGYGDAYYLGYANKPTGVYGVFGGPGNAYYRGEPTLNARFSPGYTSDRYGLSDFRRNQAFYSEGFTPRYGVVRNGLNDGFAFSPGYTGDRYGLPFEQNGGFLFSPGYYPRYGAIRYGYANSLYVW